MKTILVTGGAGFIGSHTTLALLELGYKVIVFDSFINSSKKVINSILELVLLNQPTNRNNLFVFEGDLRDIDKISEVFRKATREGNYIDCVIHFAGFKSVANSFFKPIDYWENNL